MPQPSLTISAWQGVTTRGDVRQCSLCGNWQDAMPGRVYTSAGEAVLCCAQCLTPDPAGLRARMMAYAHGLARKAAALRELAANATVTFSDDRTPDPPRIH